MRALLLAGGMGTRLRPLTNRVPKCLVPIHGRPLLEYWLDLLLPSGIECVLINTHYLPDQVRGYVAASPWCSRITLVHEESLLGTGGTVLANADFFANDSFMVAHADNLTCFSVSDFIKAHESRPQGAAITMMTFLTDVPQSCGIVELDGAGLVQAFHEKMPHPPGNQANAAVYIFAPEVVTFMRGLGKPVVDLSTEVIPHFLGRITTWLNTDYHRDIGTPGSLAMAEAEFVQ